VIDLVPADPRVYPVGRLDADSAGLILLTNDGDLTNRITHPRYGVSKTYSVLVSGKPNPGQVRQLVAGVRLEDGPAAAISARLLDTSRGRALLEVTMGEGRKREVRRMFDAIGFPVVQLFRTAIGPVTDPNLKTGEIRALTMGEVRSLYAAAAPL
jgi:23S rRNA pseudouridine2605 synthase